MAMRATDAEEGRGPGLTASSPESSGRTKPFTGSIDRPTIDLDVKPATPPWATTFAIFGTTLDDKPRCRVFALPAASNRFRPPIDFGLKSIDDGLDNKCDAVHVPRREGHDKRGLVSYLRENLIIEQNLLVTVSQTRTVAELSFTPSSLTALALGPNDEDTLYAARGSWKPAPTSPTTDPTLAILQRGRHTTAATMACESPMPMRE
ncbi:hypothetical protein DFP72DRAFT_1079595 [Ephemerocybe angulata]|uniref:Uncharacterized protein n=1 Tax=Ephemerocybe angulata TaxID=980116 RepID=A0A8H6HB94_9AGAR|nr:hypothetical protein DFP72DRAFT_1079595 [Tulosesus angulatus]